MKKIDSIPIKVILFKILPKYVSKNPTRIFIQLRKLVLELLLEFVYILLLMKKFK